MTDTTTTEPTAEQDALASVRQELAALRRQVEVQSKVIDAQAKRTSHVGGDATRMVTGVQQRMWLLVPVTMLIVAFFVPALTVGDEGPNADYLVLPKIRTLGAVLLVRQVDGIVKVCVVVAALLAVTLCGMAAHRVAEYIDPANDERATGSAAGTAQAVLAVLLVLAVATIVVRTWSENLDRPMSANGGLLLFAAAGIWLVGEGWTRRTELSSW